MENRFVTVKEAAVLLGVDIKTIYRAIAAKELPARRIRRSLRIPRWTLVERDPDHIAHCRACGQQRATVGKQEPVASLEG